MTTLTKAGRYELLEELGRGAMGVVYRAHDPVIGRSVAVKTMRLSEEATGMSHDELLSRFQTEARAAGLLAHPNIVTVYDAGEEEGLFYITMELVEGRSLQSLLDASQSFPLPRVLRIMEQACSALEFAHQHNIVHRDIKPANMMLAPDDTVKITDFGTAKILQFGTAQTQHVIGTPSYMSPEQVKGKLVDGRSDIFSLGVILYELVTGEKPFPGQDITTVIYKIVNEEPIPPRELDSTVHPGLSRVITRALAKQPEARYQSCRDFLHALRNYREQGASDATVVMPTSGASGGRGEAATLEATGATVSASRPAAEGTLPKASAALPRDTATLTEPQQLKRGGKFLLTLILIVLIGVVGKQIWPLLREIWQLERAERAAQSSRTTVSQPSPATRPPSVGTTPNTSKESTAPEEKPAQPNARQENAQEPQSIATPAQPEPAPPAPKNVPSHGVVSRPSKPSRPTSAERDLQLRVEQRLARANLAGKVFVQVSGNSVTLSGKLFPREHRQLLWQLRDIPDAVRVIDHIEYADPPLGEQANPDEAQLTSAEADGRGSVALSSEPPGAEILIDGYPTGRRTPTLLPLRAGEHTFTFLMRGYAPARRTIVVEAAQATQISVSLH